MLKEIEAKLTIESSTDRRLDIIYEIIDDALIAGDFGEVNHMFNQIDCEKYGVTELLGFLSITLMAHSRLPNRSWFYEKCKIELLKRRPLNEVNELLNGLAFPYQNQTKSKPIVTK